MYEFARTGELARPVSLFLCMNYRKYRKTGGRGGHHVWAKRSRIEIVQVIADELDFPPNGGVTVSTGSLAAKRHAGVWAPVIARKMIIADHQLAYAA